MNPHSILSFKCQTCQLPLVINESLLNLSLAQEKLLVSDKSFRSNGVATNPAITVRESERLNKYNEALRQTDKQRPVLGNHVVTGADFGKVEEELLRELAELEVGLDDMDSDKLLELIAKIKDREEEIQPRSTFSDSLGFSLGGNDEFESDSYVKSSRIRSLTRIFKILSFKYDIDYPICEECSEALVVQLNSQYDEALREKNSYLKFLNRLNKQPPPADSKLDGLLTELDSLNSKYDQSMLEIRALEAEEQSLKHEIETANQQIEKLGEKETQVLMTKNMYELELEELYDANKLKLNNLEQATELYKQLKASNVLNDVFNISYDGAFGTINGLRLGNLKTCKISWLEINSALGQIVLLLAIIIKKLALEISGYKLIPLGSYSKIEKLEQENSQSPELKTTVLECYSSGSSTFERLFTHDSLDQSLVALIHIVKNIEEELKRKFESSIELPYAINLSNNKIGGLNIKLNRKITDDEWTMACKFFITDVKYILAYSSSKVIAS